MLTQGAVRAQPRQAVGVTMSLGVGWSLSSTASALRSVFRRKSAQAQPSSPPAAALPVVDMRVAALAAFQAVREPAPPSPAVDPVARRPDVLKLDDWGRAYVQVRRPGAQPVDLRVAANARDAVVQDIRGALKALHAATQAPAERSRTELAQAAAAKRAWVRAGLQLCVPDLFAVSRTDAPRPVGKSVRDEMARVVDVLGRLDERFAAAGDQAYEFDKLLVALANHAGILEQAGRHDPASRVRALQGLGAVASSLLDSLEPGCDGAALDGLLNLGGEFDGAIKALRIEATASLLLRTEVRGARSPASSIEDARALARTLVDKEHELATARDRLQRALRHAGFGRTLGRLEGIRFDASFMRGLRATYGEKARAVGLVAGAAFCLQRQLADLPAAENLREALRSEQAELMARQTKARAELATGRAADFPPQALEALRKEIGGLTGRIGALQRRATWLQSDMEALQTGKAPLFAGLTHAGLTPAELQAMHLQGKAPDEVEEAVCSLAQRGMCSARDVGEALDSLGMVRALAEPLVRNGDACLRGKKDVAPDWSGQAALEDVASSPGRGGVPPALREALYRGVRELQPDTRVRMLEGARIEFATTALPIEPTNTFGVNLRVGGGRLAQLEIARTPEGQWELVARKGIEDKFGIELSAKLPGELAVLGAGAEVTKTRLDGVVARFLTADAMVDALERLLSSDPPGWRDLVVSSNVAGMAESVHARKVGAFARVGVGMGMSFDSAAGRALNEAGFFAGARAAVTKGKTDGASQAWNANLGIGKSSSERSIELAASAGLNGLLGRPQEFGQRPGARAPIGALEVQYRSTVAHVVKSKEARVGNITSAGTDRDDQYMVGAIEGGALDKLGAGQLARFIGFLAASDDEEDRRMAGQLGDLLASAGDNQPLSVRRLVEPRMRELVNLLRGGALAVETGRAGSGSAADAARSAALLEAQARRAIDDADNYMLSAVRRFQAMDVREATGLDLAVVKASKAREAKAEYVQSAIVLDGKKDKVRAAYDEMVHQAVAKQRGAPVKALQDKLAGFQQSFGAFAAGSAAGRGAAYAAFLNSALEVMPDAGSVAAIRRELVSGQTVRAGDARAFAARLVRRARLAHPGFAWDPDVLARLQTLQKPVSVPLPASAARLRQGWVSGELPSTWNVNPLFEPGDEDGGPLLDVKHGVPGRDEPSGAGAAGRA